MPVLIAAFERDIDIVRAVAARLLDDGGEVRCYLEDDDHELRQMGCKVAVGSLSDDFNLEAALTNVHTFMPLLPDALSFGEDQIGEIVGFGQAASAAVGGANIAQTIAAISGLTDAPAASALEQVAASLIDKASPLCLIRTGLLWGDERPLRKLSLGEDEGVVLEVDALVAVLAAADDHEELQADWSLGGTSRELASQPTKPAPDWVKVHLARAALPNSAAIELGVDI